MSSLGNRIETNGADARAPIGIHLSMPDGQRLPIDELISTHERVLRTEGRNALEYGGNQGFEGLRQWLAADYSVKESAPVGAERIVLTSGASGGLKNLCDALIDPGNVILSEEPTFSGSIRTLVASGAEVVGIPIGQDGLDPDDLGRTVREIEHGGKRIKLLYLVPNFNNPTAALLSRRRRERIAEICHESGILVVQDDAFADLSLGPELPTSFWSIMAGEGVAVLGTFSKTLAPGLRLGWIVAPGKVTDALLRGRLDLGVSSLTAHVVADYCASGGYRSHVRDMIPVYRRKRDVLLNELHDHRDRLGTWNVPEGGFSLWIKLESAVDALLLQEAARNERVLVAAGHAFFVDKPRSQAIRLCFSNASEAELKEAVRRLGKALDVARSQTLAR